MKKALYLSSIVLFFLSSQISAQQKEQAVRFANGNFITDGNIQKQSFKKENIKAALYGDNYFVLVQFAALPTKQQQQYLKKAGVQLDIYLPGNAYMATIKKDFEIRQVNQFGITSINAVPPVYKISKELINYQPATTKNGGLITVSYFKSLSKSIVQKELKDAGAIIAITKYTTTDIIFIEADKKTLDAIAALPFVTSLNLQVIEDKPLNYVGRAAHGVSALNAINGKNLNGKGVTIGIGDNADFSSHIDFAGRLILRTPTVPAYHGTHVAGTVAGAGIVNVKYRGMAAKATIINQYFSDIITSAPAYVTDNNMVATNNSYYSGLSNCPGEGVYDVLSNYADLQLGQYKQLLHVVAAGNDGALTCAGFPASFGTIKSGWQCAKNVLTVGNMYVQDYSISYSSSRGPVADGRIKPEIVANGTNVISTIPNNSYGYSTGTSMASPAVTGSLALMYERYRQLHSSANPPSALIKALVCNTAEDLGNAGPDYTFGFGMLNVQKAVEAIDSNRYFINSINNGNVNAQTINVPANTRRLKILLYWADTAAAVNAATTLVNDLDITVTEPSSTIHRPMVLNPVATHVNDVAIEGTDHTNNVEQVIIENPSAGTYTINVAGFSVPFGPQQYVLSYEILKPSVTLQYPFGGETWVPGETEIIRWNAYGNESNTFTIDSSVNNGASWGTISNAVSANSRSFSWAVPNTITNTALVRVSRNGTLLTGQSTAGIVLLGQPAITATNVCVGAVQLNWAGISGASSYDILQLDGDSMKVIGNTASNSFLVQGLNKMAATWLGVAAKNGSFSGRRSISVSVLPNSGSCTLTVFNNDLQVDSILTPNTARQQFSNASNATAAVKILIRNLGSTTVSGPFTVSYNYGGATVAETFSGTIAAGGTSTYTFTGAYPIIASGYTYNFKAWATLAADANHLNDTTYKIVKSINNDPITTMPVTEGFELMPNADYTVTEMAIGENKNLDFTANSLRGRARSFVNTGFAHSGKRSITLDQWPANAVTTVDSLTFNYNLINYAANQVRLDFYYNNHGQANNAGNKVWIRGSENNTWVQAYDLFINQAAIGHWKYANININDILNNALPAQTITQTFQIKIGEEGNTSANDATPLNDNDDGYTIDDLTINQVNNDIALVNIISPAKSGCGLTANNPISINLKNYNNTVLNNIDVSYQVNGGSIVTETIPSIAASQSLNYTFAQTTNLAAYIDYSLNVWIHYAGDTYPINDSILNYTFHNTPIISTYPYLQSFEADNGNFYTNGINSSWQWGTPAKIIISKAPNGSKAWVTSLTSNYNDNETSYLYTPCFDVSLLAQPMLSFSHIYNVELNYDYSWVEYSTDGIVWQKLGLAGNGTNWYDNTTLNKWNISKNKWHVASIELPLTAGTMRFRFVMSSDNGVTMEGIGIDDIHVFDKASIYTGPAITSITQNVSGTGWVDYISGGKKIVSLNANAANLGATVVQVYPYAGAVRNSSNQYYANRNIVVRPANAATTNVGVRFYFTVAEADSAIAANSCATCTKINDAYELGITKYSGSSADENDLLVDDLTGFFQFIPVANRTLVPYDNGYYAEFTVKSFSEFWLSKNLITPAASGVCPGTTVIYTTAISGTVYQWQQDNGTGFTNIINGANYTGATTNTLQLINLPTAYNGYQYRCVINGVNDAPFTLRYSMAWNGSVSTDWFNTANWSCNLLPDQYTDVIIPGGLTNYPFINSNTSVRSLRAHPGAPITVASGVNFILTGK